MRTRGAFLLLLAGLLARCGMSPASPEPAPLRSGTWRMVLDLNGQELPVVFTMAHDSAGHQLELHNGEERVLVKEVSLRGDSVHIRMPLFDTEILAERQGDSVLTGVYWNHLRKAGEDKVRFRATAGAATRFSPAAPAADIAGHWEAHFSTGTPDAYPALGLFHQVNGIVTGTFGTETGDYRFLEGVLDGDTLRLTSFNGSQAFLFKAALRNDSLVGRFWSGIHWSEPWFAVRNDRFRLRDPDSLTVLKEGHDMVDFRFPTIDGDTVSSSDERYRGKPLVVQVMGSWCANCMDEAVLLNELYGRYRDEGLEVVAIAFEKHPSAQQAVRALERFRNGLGIGYPIAYAGPATKDNTREQLPFLERMMSYPTCIFIDRTGTVRKIHTGFYGPGTGEFYEAFRRDVDLFIRQLLAESGTLAEAR